MKNRNFTSLRGYGVEISFKKWAMLTAYGNLSLLPIKTVVWTEKLIDWCGPAANTVGKIMARLTGKVRWESVTLVALEDLVRRLDARKGNLGGPDAFLLEVYNPASESVRIQLRLTPLKRISGGQTALLERAPSFVTTMELPSGYSRHQIEMSLLNFATSSTGYFDISMIPEADTNARLVFLTADFVKFAPKPAAARELKKIKCVVWDLDNTLWNGVLAEGDAVALRPEVASVMKQLDERGILLSIASKNDFETAWRKIEECGISSYFVAPQINWAPKSQNIREIATRLNLGLDAFAFVDDSPFELDEVARSFPDVLCIRADQLKSILADPRFEGSSSNESRRRRQLYQEATVRDSARAEFGSDYVSFLASCGITLDIAPYTHEDSERVAELVQRTNQLNFSGHKYTRAELEKVLADGHVEKLLLKCSDRYGSYGTVGFAIVEQTSEAIRIRDFMLSCRVQGKMLEQAFFSHLLEHHNGEGSKDLWVNFRETGRNKPAQLILKSLGFRECSANSNLSVCGMRRSSQDSLRCEFVRVRCSAASRPETTTPVLLTRNLGPRDTLS